MLESISTGPYPPGQVNPAELCESERELELVGLGLLPMALIAAGQETGTFSWIGNTLGGLFPGDTPDHDIKQVRQWASDLATGVIGPCAGPFDTYEVLEAIASAPRGRAGDDPGTVEGLRTALIQPMPELEPYVRTDTALGRVAVGVAHGRLDCVVGWQEEPAVAHLGQLVEDYRDRPAPAPRPQTFLESIGLAPAPAPTNGAPTVTGAPPLAVAGLPRFAIPALGAAALAAYLLRKR